MPDGDGQQRLVYDIHVFCCINQREPGHPRGSCAARGSVDLHKYLKIRSKQLKIDKIRVNKAGCLDRCELGPVLVIYPQAIWYRFDSESDIDEILERQIIGGETVDRLLLDADQKVPKISVEPRLRLRVEKIESLTSKIKKFELVGEDGGRLPSFTAGSHIDVFTGNELRRSYSLAGDPELADRYQIAVLREPGDGGSAWIHDSLALGDVIEATAPKNNFPLDETASEHLLIAGGIGITPMVSMGWAISNGGARATLHYTARSPETTAFAADVKEIFGSRATIYHDGGDPSRGIDLGRVLADPAPGTCLYVCGPSGLIDAAREAAAHWPQDKIRFERFSGSAQEPVEGDNRAFDIFLSRQGITLTVAADKTILQAIQDAGIEIDFMCEQGFCGTCHTKLLGGKADHRDEFLKENDKAGNSTIMICTSRAEPGETLILDI